MESMNYTYQEIHYNGAEFHVISKEGKTMAVCDREDDAALIVSALTGVAV